MDSRELKADFDKNGFVVIPQFLPDHEFAELRRELRRYIETVVPAMHDTDALYDDKSKPETLKQLQRMECDSYFRDYAAHPRWQRVAETLLGEAASATGGEWFNKPAGTMHPTPAHQDNFYFNLAPPLVVTLWLALEAVDEENGCLRYVRGSHLRGCRPHASSDVLGFSQTITDYGPEDTSLEFAAILSANDLVAHHGWTIHRAEPNRSAVRHRPSFAMVFRGESCELDTEGYARYEHSLNVQHQSLGLHRNTE